MAVNQVMAEDNGNDHLAQFDSIEVSLLTCSPHEEIYSLYGHSALRWHDMRQSGLDAGSDIVFNWGIFNFNKPYFVLRFVFGLTDYELGPIPFQPFCSYYQQWGSSVTEQVLNLTNEEKMRLKAALAENLKPENRIYRYNYFYDNCSTRPRDIVEKCLNGKLEYAQREDYTPSYREMVSQCTRNHRWATFGNDMLLGIKSDFKTNMREQEFLPENLMYDFDHAQIYAAGAYRPLVKERRMPVMPGVQVIEHDFPLTPMECARLRLVCHAVLTAPHHQHQPTDSVAQSAPLVLHPVGYPPKCHALAKSTANHDNSLPDWRYFPALCRGNDDCGTIFAPKNLAVTEFICNFAAVF